VIEGVGVELEVEAAELGGEMRIAGGRLDFRSGEGGPHGRVDQEQLLFGSDPAPVRFDQAVLQKVLEGLDVPQQALHEVPLLLGILVGGDL